MQKVQVSMQLLKAMTAYCLEQAVSSDINIHDFAENYQGLDLADAIADLADLKEAIKADNADLKDLVIIQAETYAYLESLDQD
jgi:hypothetical protein